MFHAWAMEGAYLSKDEATLIVESPQTGTLYAYCSAEVDPEIALQCASGIYFPRPTRRVGRCLKSGA